MVKVLIVEDEREIAAQVAKYALKNGYQPIVLNSGEKVVEVVKQELPCIIILDVMLPVKTGVECCQEIRRFSDVPIIMLTARKGESDRILGLESGVDDYVCKPFSAKELMLRIKAVLKRYGKGVESSNTGLYLDKNSFSLNYNSSSVKLTTLEFSLFCLLMNTPGRNYSREQIIELAYKNDRDISDRAIDSHIKNIRKKIRTLGIEDNLIETTYGAGFRYVEMT